jgi:Tfp pilus assembly protein PilN
MIEINLLPKNYLKGSRTISLGKVGMYVIAAAAGVVLMLAGITVYQVYQLRSLETNIERANQRAAMLQKDIRLVDALIDVKQKVQERMTAVERLDRHRSVWVRLLENIAGDVPEFVWLAVYKEKPDPSSVIDASNKQSKNNQAKPQEEPAKASASGLPDVRPVEIEGYAFTLNALASFMINLMRSEYFDQVELVTTKEAKFNTNKEKAYNFVVSADAHYLSDEDLRKLVAQAGADDSTTVTSHKVLN